MERKLLDYFSSGVRLVWYVEPVACEVRVFTALDRMERLEQHQTLDGGDVLPGFALPLAEWFARAEGPKNP